MSGLDLSDARQEPLVPRLQRVAIAVVTEVGPAPQGPPLARGAASLHVERAAARCLRARRLRMTGRAVVGLEGGRPQLVARLLEAAAHAACEADRPPSSDPLVHLLVQGLQLGEGRCPRLRGGLDADAGTDRTRTLEGFGVLQDAPPVREGPAVLGTRLVDAAGVAALEQRAAPALPLVPLAEREQRAAGAVGEGPQVLRRERLHRESGGSSERRHLVGLHADLTAPDGAAAPGAKTAPPERHGRRGPGVGAHPRPRRPPSPLKSARRAPSTWARMSSSSSSQLWYRRSASLAIIFSMK